MSSEAKQAILDKHNELRRRVAKGEETGGINGPQPGASNMKKLVWSAELLTEKEDLYRYGKGGRAPPNLQLFAFASPLCDIFTLQTK